MLVYTINTGAACGIHMCCMEDLMQLMQPIQAAGASSAVTHRQDGYLLCHTLALPALGLMLQDLGERLGERLALLALQKLGRDGSGAST